MNLIRVLAAFLLLAPPFQLAFAQAFRVMSSTPAHGASSVPLETDVVFRFSDAIDLNTDWTRAFPLEPRASAKISRVFLGLDEQDRPAVLEFSTEHQENTDYVWLAFDAQSLEGGPLDEPYVLRYTTAPLIGARTVRGLLSKSGTAKRDAPRAREYVGELLRAAEALGLNQYPASAKSEYRNGNRVQEGPTLVYLLNHYTTRANQWGVRAATVASPGAESYEVEYVRNGSYWPLAVRYAPGTREIEAIGYYDADANLAPDSINLSGADAAGVDLTLFEYARRPALHFLESARSEAVRYAPDQELVTIEALYGTSYDGAAYEWRYQFYSASGNLLTQVVVDPLGAKADTMEAPEILADLSPIDNGLIDSDQALLIAEEEGGRTFRERFAPNQVVTRIDAGNLFWHYPRDPSRRFWRVEYLGNSGGGFDEFTVLVDMYSAVVLSHPRDTDIPGDVTLIGNHPNPFTSTTRIHFETSRTGRVRIAVYDVLGREVEVIIDEERGSGKHSVIWDASRMPSGVYLYQFEGGGRKQARQMLVVR